MEPQKIFFFVFHFRVNNADDEMGLFDELLLNSFLAKKGRASILTKRRFKKKVPL